MHAHTLPGALQKLLWDKMPALMRNFSCRTPSRMMMDVHVCLGVCMHVCMHVCKHAGKHVCMPAHACMPLLDEIRRPGTLQECIGIPSTTLGERENALPDEKETQHTWVCKWAFHPVERRFEERGINA